jgi:hypothetical protein
MVLKVIKKKVHILEIMINGNFSVEIEESFKTENICKVNTLLRNPISINLIPVYFYQEARVIKFYMDDKMNRNFGRMGEDLVITR